MMAATIKEDEFDDNRTDSPDPQPKTEPDPKSEPKTNIELGITPTENLDNRSAVSGFKDGSDDHRIYLKQERHKKYLSEYTVEVADDPVVLPASVIAMGGKCEAYNQYGDLLNIPNKQCLEMLSDYGKIPKRRDGQSQGLSQKNDVFSEYREDEFERLQTQDVTKQPKPS